MLETIRFLWFSSREFAVFRDMELQRVLVQIAASRSFMLAYLFQFWYILW